MSALTGTAVLARLVLRRDRVLLPVWVVLPSLAPPAFVTAFTTAYPTEQDRREYAETSLHNTAFTVVYGALDGHDLGQLVTWRAGFVPVVIALVALLTVIRHTRAEEEAGRGELVGAAVVGRHAGLAAALTVTCAAALTAGLVSALALVASGLPVGGSLAFGLGLAASGWAFAAVGAVVAQLTT
ncbi:ABC transporter permease, partial [Nonomuraea aridisoli]